MTILHPNNPAILILEASGDVAAYASLGGYPLFYLTDDNGVLCPTCVQENLDLCTDNDPQWHVQAHDANWEDPSLHCDHCSARVESAYAEDEVPS